MARGEVAFRKLAGYPNCFWWDRVRHDRSFSAELALNVTGSDVVRLLVAAGLGLIVPQGWRAESEATPVGCAAGPLRPEGPRQNACDTARNAQSRFVFPEQSAELIRDPALATWDGSPDMVDDRCRRTSMTRVRGGSSIGGTTHTPVLSPPPRDKWASALQPLVRKWHKACLTTESHSRTTKIAPTHPPSTMSMRAFPTKRHLLSLENRTTDSLGAAECPNGFLRNFKSALKRVVTNASSSDG
jgi:hypothetical protein